jgi:hypothetical protein
MDKQMLYSYTKDCYQLYKAVRVTSWKRVEWEAPAVRHSSSTATELGLTISSNYLGALESSLTTFAEKVMVNFDESTTSISVVGR